jgi:hypothetical protein
MEHFSCQPHCLPDPSSAGFRCSKSSLFSQLRISAYKKPFAEYVTSLIMKSKPSGPNRDASLPRESWRDRFSKRFGLRADMSRSTSLSNRSSHQLRDACSTSKSAVDIRTIQVEPTANVRTITASSAQVEPNALVGDGSVTHDAATGQQKQNKLQKQGEDRPGTEETASGSKVPDGEPKEQHGNVVTHESAGCTKEPEDFWALAKERLRQDTDKREIIDKFDLILKKPENIGSALEHPGTGARRKQIDAFFKSKTKKLESAEDEDRLSQCKKSAKRFFRTAIECVTATQGIINHASAPCLPASVACAGVTLLLTVGLIIQCAIKE